MIYEVYSDAPKLVNKPYWYDYNCAIAYAAKLQKAFVNNYFAVRRIAQYRTVNFTPHSLETAESQL